MSPSDCCIIAFITRVPKPLCFGFVTHGPLLSAHWMTTDSFDVRDHVTFTRPSGTDKAPYFAAFVANSCKATAMHCANCDANIT
jgi:hypothetical protein